MTKMGILTLVISVSMINGDKIIIAMSYIMHKDSKLFTPPHPHPPIYFRRFWSCKRIKVKTMNKLSQILTVKFTRFPVIVSINREFIC